MFISSGTVCLPIYSLVAGIFGVNLPYTWNLNHGYLFKWELTLLPNCYIEDKMWLLKFYIKVIDYGVHKLWKYNNVGVFHLLPTLSIPC
ncbi:magnesium transporter MRS2-I-like [Magnolia sinica]|uniref:magnesium transporter MRS2-I-like n=1 Tax=Magnolia sinica TaxID=86752 RepID=UPI00265ADFA6|nr:magnesium transporter MRS2-I-like [Magnolia sinica]